MLGSMLYANPIKVILDTDMDSDIDDVAALAMLHHFADLGEVEILATVSCSSDRYSDQLVHAINTAFNRPGILLGAARADAPKHAWALKSETLLKEFPSKAKRKQTMPAAELYRKVLASQPDKSVVIISLGYLNNLKDLLLSSADKYSPLTGAELVAKKVASYYCMGGTYPADTQDSSIYYGNFRPDPASTAYVSQHWPTRLVFTGGGDFAAKLKSGNILKQLPQNNIVRRAYELAKGDVSKDWSHHSADVITVWTAVRGTAPYFKETTMGYNEIDQYGRNTWKTNRDQPNHSYISDLKEGVEPEQVIEAFDAVLSRLSVTGLK